ncbi:DNA translocase FtsK [Alteribacillus iranensis]|uniref:DNA segregation ATPase FtsK/SpoIIIE, S-DNA-T family n=1 Tax=Alteribacillus iranensis TaxID=930128 RepID=A0A1I2ETY1_9BACI|nr:DNA translocase FtsK [Alteribacillus iranensis]SFE95680.1 DNA segregation ATPase FtsK/SpoIIIE, S-DNA-T family [Alteribacillus iranensis]
MAGSFKHIIKRLQNYLFGEETEVSSPRREENHAANRSSGTGREKGPRVACGEASGVKMVHHYPRQGVESARGNRLTDIREQRAMRKKKERSVEVSESLPTSEKREEAPQKQVNQTREKERNNTVKEEFAQKRSFFQGNNFEAGSIPSPVFGYQKYSLHPDAYRKTTEMILRDPEIESKQPLQEESLREPKHDDASTHDLVKPAEQKEQNIINSLELDSGNDYGGDHAEEKEIVEEENIQSETYKEESKVSAESEEENHLSRSERRRQQALERKKEKKTDNDKTTAVPFNVLMYPNQGKKTKKNDPVYRSTNGTYQFPGLSLLNIPPRVDDEDSVDLQNQKEQLEATLHNFNVKAKVINVTKGPAVTRFEVQPEAGVKVNKITNLTDDIKLALAAKDLRMEAPIPGKSAIGIEVPNQSSKPVFLREILRRDVFTRSTSPLTVAMGLDISGNPVVSDLQKMPHGLIAGATGSGKSVCINSILLSLLYKARPDELKLMLIDPKMVELASYKDVPHLVTPVINDAKQATAGLKWAVEEMEERYEKLAHEGVRDIKKYNERMEQQQNHAQKMPYIVIVIDELADLMMVAPQDVEDAVCRIAQKARACGIHLLLATQRPSVDVITGLIKANIPSRTAFAVSSQADSRTILDIGGAERLIGKGDMLFYENGSAKPIRVQGTFVSDEEIEVVTDYTKSQQKPSYLFDQEELKKKADHQDNVDELFEEACQFVADQGSASSSLLQRRFSIGYNRAAKLIDAMEQRGIISEAMGSKPRRVLMTSREIEENITI